MINEERKDGRIMKGTPSNGGMSVSVECSCGRTYEASFGAQINIAFGADGGRWPKCPTCKTLCYTIARRVSNETLAALATILDYNGSLGRGNERLLLIETLRLRQIYDPTDPPPEAPKKVVFKDIPGTGVADKEG